MDGMSYEKYIYTSQSRIVFSRFLDLRGNIKIVKENRLRKLVSTTKRLRASAMQKFAWRRFFEVNGISIVFSWEIRAYCRKNGKCVQFFRKRAKKGKIFENLAKMYKIWKYFENGQPRACDYRMHETASICPRNRC